MNIFQKIKGVVGHAVSAPVTLENHLFQYITLDEQERNKALDVKRDQTVVLYKPGNLNGAKIYTTGVYSLNEIFKELNGSYLEGIFFRHGAQFHGHWHYRYRDSEAQNLLIAGENTLTLEGKQVTQFARFLTKNSAYRSEEDLMNYLAEAVEFVMTNQHILVRDILNSEKFPAFLQKSLECVFEKLGIALSQFSCALEVPETGEEMDGPEEEPRTLDHKKIYYRIIKGEQEGPFSAQDLQNDIDAGRLKPTQLIWYRGSNWVPVSTLRDLHFPE